MAEITTKLHKQVAKKFPVMNVIIGSESDEHKGTKQVREIDGHNVTLIIGISNVYIIDAEELKDVKE